MDNTFPQFVVVEGVDGVGKTTLAKRLERECGYVYFSPPIAPFSAIRKSVEDLHDIEARFFYYLASVIAAQPALRGLLASKRRVVADRYIYSTFAMHEALGASVDAVDLSKLPIIKPDAGIHLTVDPEARLNRIEERAAQKSAVGQEDRYTTEGERAILAYNSFPILVPVDTTHLNLDEVFSIAVSILKGAS